MGQETKIFIALQIIPDIEEERGGKRKFGDGSKWLPADAGTDGAQFPTLRQRMGCATKNPQRRTTRIAIISHPIDVGFKTDIEPALG